MLILRSIILIILFMVSGCAQYDTALEKLESIEPDSFTCTVLEVKSAYTFLCQFPGLDLETIRLAGITVPGNKENAAKSFAKKVLTRGTLVNIEPVNDSKVIDNGIPAYVWVPGGKMLNILLVERGYAEVLQDEVTQKYEAVFNRAASNQNQDIEVIEEVEIEKDPWRK